LVVAGAGEPTLSYVLEDDLHLVVRIDAEGVHWAAEYEQPGLAADHSDIFSSVRLARMGQTGR